MHNNKITLIGAGLSGPLMATYLTHHGYNVDIYEKRSDIRINNLPAGRSINLALSIRGIRALKEVGVYEEIKPLTSSSFQTRTRSKPFSLSSPSSVLSSSESSLPF